MFRVFTISVASLISFQTAYAQYPNSGPALNRSGYGGYATGPIVYPDRTGLGGYRSPAGPGGLFSPGVARNGYGGLASSAGPSTPTFTYFPGGMGGNPAQQTGLFNPVIGSGAAQASRPVTYFSFSNPAPSTSGSGSGSGGYYVIPRR